MPGSIILLALRLQVKRAADEVCRRFVGVPGMAHFLPVRVRSRVLVAKCSEPQVESREAGMEEAV